MAKRLEAKVAIIAGGSNGIGEGTVGGVSPAAVEEQYHRDGRGRALGLMSAGSALGALLVPVVVWI